MRTDIWKKYLFIISVVFLSVYLLLFSLLNKYYGLVISHVISQCKFILTSFFTSEVHLAGLLIVSLIVVTGTALLLRIFFTYIKTQLKIGRQTKFITNSKFNKVIENLCKGIEINSEKICIIQSKNHIAFSFGIFNSKIFISTGLINDLTRKELEAVLIHEKYHICNFHTLTFIYLEISKSLLFFIPVTGALVKKIKLLLEFNADQNAISAQGTDKYLRYALATTLSTEYKQAIFPNFSVSYIEQRINMLIGKKVSFNLQKYELLISIFTLTLLIAMYFFPTSTHASADQILFQNAGNCNNNQNMTRLTLNMTVKPQ